MRLPLDSNRQIFHEFAADPHFADVLGLGQETDPVEGIFRESEEICVVSGLELSAFRPLRAQSKRSRRRRGFDGLKRFHSGLDEMAHLVAVEPPSGRSTGGREDVGPGRHPHALANRDPQRLLVLLVDRQGLVVRILGDPAFLPDANESIDDEPGWHEDRIAGEHQVRGFFIEERPMLDRPASGSERGDDSGFAVAVGGDDSVRAGRLPDDRFELLARELSMDRMVELARDAARREDLDDPRSDPELHPDAFQALRHAVAEVRETGASQHVVDEVERERVEVSVASGLTQRSAGSVDARPMDRPFRDGPGQVNAESAELPDAREPRGDRDLCVFRRSGREHGERRAGDLFDVQSTDPHEMSVDVPHSRHQGGHIHDGCAGGRGGAFDRTRICDRRAVDDQRGVPDRFSASRDEDVGCKTRTWAKGGHPLVIGELDVGAPVTLIVYEMYDVQPVGDLKAWQAPPFAAEIRDVPGVGRAVIGRGSTNSKGALANHLFTWKTIRDVDEMPVNLKILAEGEEEISSANFIAYIRTHRRELKADAAIANDYSEDLRGVPTIYLGVKGCLYLTVWSRGNPQAGGPMDSEIHSSNAVWIGSPVWRLLQALNTLVDEDQRPAIDGIWEDVVPPTKADTAMVKTLAKTFDPSAWLQEERTAKFKFDLPKDQLLLKYLFEPTVNICGIYSGYIEHGGTKTVLPHEAYAKIDIRLVKAMTVERTLRKLRDHLKKRGYDDLRIEVHGPYGPAKTDPESWIAKAAIEAVQANGKEPEVWPSSGGTMPAFAFDEYLKLPWVSTGLGHGSRAHAPNEYASIDGMKRFLAGLATLLYAAAKRAPKRRR